MHYHNLLYLLKGRNGKHYEGQISHIIDFKVFISQSHGGRELFFKIKRKSRIPSCRVDKKQGWRDTVNNRIYWNATNSHWHSTCVITMANVIWLKSFCGNRSQYDAFWVSFFFSKFFFRTKQKKNVIVNVIPLDIICRTFGTWVYQTGDVTGVTFLIYLALPCFTEWRLVCEHRFPRFNGLLPENCFDSVSMHLLASSFSVLGSAFKEARFCTQLASDQRSEHCENGKLTALVSDDKKFCNDNKSYSKISRRFSSQRS